MIYTLGLKGLPFEPHPKQIIYVENTYDEQVNEFIQRNYDSICAHFAENGYEFVYLPLLSSQLDDEVRSYYNPTNNISKNSPIKSCFILDFMAQPENRDQIMPSLIYCKIGLERKKGEESVMRGITIDFATLCDTTFSSLLADIVEDLMPKITPDDAKYYSRSHKSFADEGVMCEAHQIDVSDSLDRSHAYIDEYHPPKSKTRSRSFWDKICGFREEDVLLEDPTPLADDTFDEETKRLMWEVQVRIDELKRKGIEQYVLESIFRTPIAPSHMVITSDYRILLPDYNDMEIEMTPLVKAVYILFLRHPEGIPFKCLCDYRKELLTIYSDVRGGWLTNEMKRSVESATDPYNNSINEKCARIREAFIKKFDERLIGPYIVRGERACPKGISLPREMVEWQTK